MSHLLIERILKRAEISKSDSDFSYFFSLLLAAEALTKTIVLGLVSTISEDKDRNRYRLEHQLVRADGIGDWGRVLDDAVTGTASQFLAIEARIEQSEITKSCSKGEWQFDAVYELKNAIDILGLDSEEFTSKTDFKRWFRLFSTLRNKTRAHGATLSEHASNAAPHLMTSIMLIYNNFSIFKRPWLHLHRNLSGKYRVTPINDDISEFSHLTKKNDLNYANGIYLKIGELRKINLIETNSDLRDFYISNGGMSNKKYELLSYETDDRIDGDGTAFLVPPGTLPASNTEGKGELIPIGNCLSNAPDLPNDYISRPELENELLDLINDNKRPIITLLGRGGIGKTSLALKVIQELYKDNKYLGIVWLSSRDVDLQLTGPKPVRPLVLSPDDMGKYYASLVLTEDKTKEKQFNPREYLEKQLQTSDFGTCLFVFDNFETTQNPAEMFSWIDSFIRLPNKALITTRLREFKGDYPVEVGGMTEEESTKLINQTAIKLGVDRYIDGKYTRELIEKSEGHPYVIKVLLGEVAKNKSAGSITRLVAGTEDILTALFERTYSSLSPCSQRAFLTLSAWNSAVPKLALEAVLYRSTNERLEVEKGVEALLQYSMAEIYITPNDQQEFIRLPLVASVFGKKKLNINPTKQSILSDVEILQMMGPSRKDDMTLGLAKKIENLIKNIAIKVESGDEYAKYQPIIEIMCRAYPSGWLIVARWKMELRSQDGYELAKQALNRLLENSNDVLDISEGWRLLGHCCYQTGDTLGEVHAFTERAELSHVPFYDLSNTANRFFSFIKDSGESDLAQNNAMANRILQMMDNRVSEAEGTDLSRMAWLAIKSGQESAAIKYVKEGLDMEPENLHLIKLSQRLKIYNDVHHEDINYKSNC
ncbi:NB-ARC domain-containing protein [Aeromonas dhakensis]|uniref:NB-ARC domain-containing protein n=1 Tax=Aeromonas dhakensis TaxID=196024 RepID=UPI00111993B5|nr:NB-ARC domain-containing protein [Aeromonas dhakensis]ELA9380890.1 hypothetical protein [Aeromonas hydrophila]TND54373.1 hypothetical protein CF129_17825 [Aeromonas dhakensis]